MQRDRISVELLPQAGGGWEGGVCHSVTFAGAVRRRSRHAARQCAAIGCVISGFALACASEPPALGEPITVAESGATHPTVAIDDARGIYYVAWVGADGAHAAVWLARSTDGVRFEAPVRVNDIDGDAAPHEQAPAQVAVARDGTVYVAWQNNTHVPGRRFPYSDLRLARSDDAGRTFEPAITVNDDAGSPASHTFHDITIAPDGTIYVSWIDGRTRAAAERELAALHETGMSAGPSDPAPETRDARGNEHAAHRTALLPPSGERREAGMDPVAALPPQEIRVARSTDGGRTFGTNRIVAFDPCPCCRTSMAVAPNGDVFIAWRAIFGDNIRDIVVARSADRGSTFDEPVRVHDDRWHINGCPHAGPSLAVVPDGAVHIAWYTGAEGGSGVFHAVSRDGARTFGPPTPLLEAEPLPVSRVHLAATADGRVLAAWDDPRGHPARPPSPGSTLAASPPTRSQRVDRSPSSPRPASAAPSPGSRVTPCAFGPPGDLRLRAVSAMSPTGWRCQHRTRSFHRQWSRAPSGP